jgi:hypothetical protein
MKGRNPSSIISWPLRALPGLTIAMFDYFSSDPKPSSLKTALAKTVLAEKQFLAQSPNRT